jgi:hypothetical protein
VAGRPATSFFLFFYFFYYFFLWQVPPATCGRSTCHKFFLFLFTFFIFIFLVFDLEIRFFLEKNIWWRSFGSTFVSLHFVCFSVFDVKQMANNFQCFFSEYQTIYMFKICFVSKKNGSLKMKRFC